jgi:hypothetical protein
MRRLRLASDREASAAFEEAVDTAESPEALDGLGRSLWWLREGREASHRLSRARILRIQARRPARPSRADRTLALARVRPSIRQRRCRSWLAGAGGAPLRDVAPGAEQGWLDLARSESSRDSSEAAMYAEAALNSALAVGDSDLELRALGQLGYAVVSSREVDDGLAQLDEAMAAATGG